ncbi:MAG: ABC transporter ATP-binding protein [Verrucomicrobiota bacterium]
MPPDPPEPKTSATVSFTAVSFAYDSNIPIIEDATFSIPPGESLCIIGPNGGGKTTLFKLILGLLKPNRGTVTVLGTTPGNAAPRVGYMPQHLQYDPKFPVTARDIVLMGRVNKHIGGRYSRADKEAALQALDRMDLVDQAGHSFAKLSGGQRQRVLIARALVCDPQLLLLDEPTANVDLAVEAQFLETIESLKKSLTILTVTHDLGVIPHLGQRVLCVNRHVHSHLTADLTGDVIREIFSGELRLDHERHSLHAQDDHTQHYQDQ